MMVLDLHTLTSILFAPPFLLDYVITCFLCYFLHNLHVRFWTLNDLWECLPAELVGDHDKWTHIDIVLFMEKMRLINSELCDLLKQFTMGFGPLILAFFTFSYSCLLLGCFFMVTRFHVLVGSGPLDGEAERQIFNVLFHLEIFLFMVSIIVYVSFIDEQRIKIISYLRSYKISKLHMDVKKQIKLFMSQISLSGLDQITAFGVFDVNLNLITSILVLIITGITTVIQMVHDPITVKVFNDTSVYLESFMKNTTT
ncbi:hypothetical protein AGLY_005245 [Aphis glycines]|uniref:Gustatory receptor n=1 Tax=Aphis glycines TaxID=307491 RepID=A0A6G0TYL5_APHGL|nr:hypothetical protein AGLY_005245 [Aphis glycines]